MSSLNVFLIFTPGCAYEPQIVYVVQAEYESQIETESSETAEAWWEYWLSEISIKDAIHEAGLTWAVSASYTPSGNKVYGTYTLYKDVDQIAYIRAVILNGERSLHALTLNYRGDPNIFL